MLKSVLFRLSQLSQISVTIFVILPLNAAIAQSRTVLEMPPDPTGTVGKEDPKQYIGATINSFPLRKSTASSQSLRNFGSARECGRPSGCCQRKS
jgi:hypothetical protein